MKLKYIGPPGMFNALIGNLEPGREYTVTEEVGKALRPQPLFVEVREKKTTPEEVNNG